MAENHDYAVADSEEEIPPPDLSNDDVRKRYIQKRVLIELFTRECIAYAEEHRDLMYDLKDFVEELGPKKRSKLTAAMAKAIYLAKGKDPSQTISGCAQFEAIANTIGFCLLSENLKYHLDATLTVGATPYELVKSLYDNMENIVKLFDNNSKNVPSVEDEIVVTENGIPIEGQADPENENRKDGSERKASMEGAHQLNVTFNVRSLSELGENLRAWRKSKNLNQTKAANLIGVAQADISDLELGKGNPKFMTIIQIVNATGIPINIEPKIEAATAMEASM